jgi:hypothetical protein
VDDFDSKNNLFEFELKNPENQKSVILKCDSIQMKQVMLFSYPKKELFGNYQIW